MKKQAITKNLDLLILLLLIIFSMILGIAISQIFMVDKSPSVNVYFGDWLEQDKTDDLEYIRGKFNCIDFSETLVDNAKKVDINASYTVLSFDEGNPHAIVTFDNDGYLVFIEPQSDRVLGYIDIRRYDRKGLSMVEVNNE